MVEEFQEYIDDFMDRRLNDIVVGLSKKNEEFKKLQLQSREVQEKFIAKDNEELQGLFIEYEDVINAQMAIIYREIYMTGFKDAVKIGGIVEEMKER